MTFTNDMFPRAFNNDWEVTETVVEDGDSIGANTTIVCGFRIGSYAMVGAGSVVVEDVPQYSLVVGNPAKQIGWVCKCGKRMDEKLICERCGRRYKQLHGKLEVENETVKSGNLHVLL